MITEYIRKQKRRGRKWLASLLVAALVFSLLPTHAAYADPGDATPDGTTLAPGTYTVTANLAMPGEYNPLIPGLTVYANNPNNPFGPTIDENDPAEVKGEIPSSPLVDNATLIVDSDGIKHLYLPIKNPIFTTQAIGTSTELPDVKVERTYPTVGSTTGMWEGNYNKRTDRIHKMLATLSDDLSEGTKEYNFKGSVLYAVPLDTEIKPAGEVALKLTIEYDSLEKNSDSTELPVLSEEVVGPKPSANAKPSAVENLVYTGTEQTGVVTADHYTLSGEVTATTAGEYTATATLKEGQTWEDNTTDPVTVEWSIAKAPLTATYLSEAIEFNAVPALEVQVSGFVNEESPKTAVGYKAPAVTVPEELEDGQTYELTPEGGEADNYEFSYVAGTLTVGEPSAPEDPKLTPGTYTITANPYIPGSENVVIPGLTVYLASPAFPPAIPTENNATLVVGDDGRLTLTVPLMELPAEIFTLQKLGSGPDVTVVETKRGIGPNVSGEYGPGVPDRIQEFTVELANWSGHYQFADCEQYPTILLEHKEMPVSLEVDFENASKRYVDPSEEQDSWTKTYTDEATGGAVTVETTDETIGPKLENAALSLTQTSEGVIYDALQQELNDMYSTDPVFELYSLTLKNGDESLNLSGNTKVTVALPTKAATKADVYRTDDDAIGKRMSSTSVGDRTVSFTRVGDGSAISSYVVLSTDSTYKWYSKTWVDAATGITAEVKLSTYSTQGLPFETPFTGFQFHTGIDTELNPLGTAYDAGFEAILGGVAPIMFVDEANGNNLESQVIITIPAAEDGIVYLVSDNGISQTARKMNSTYADGKLTIELYSHGLTEEQIGIEIVQPLLWKTLGVEPTVEQWNAYLLVAPDKELKLARMPQLYGADNRLRYSGFEQGLTAAEHCTVEGTASAIDAGEYVAKATPEDGYVWLDGSNGTIDIPWAIEKQYIHTNPVDKRINFGETPELNMQYRGFVNGETAETAADFVAPTLVMPEDIEPGKTYQLSMENGSSRNYVVNGAAVRLTVNPEFPQAAPDLVYNGTEQVGVEEKSGYTLSGTTRATEVGNYIATATLEYGFTWPDGTTDPVEIAWSIAAEGEVDKSVLQEAVEEVKSLDPADYTPFSWKRMQAALTVAQFILENEDATQGQVDAAQLLLGLMKDTLVKTQIDITRHSGKSAADTAAAISQAAFPEGTDFVVLARDDDYMDAMGATGLAGALDAPILTTNRTSLSQGASDEIVRLGASKVYIIGGKGAITTDVEETLSALGVEVERIYGTTAADTSVECAKAIEAIDGGRNTQDTAIVATSIDFVDALSVSSYAYRYHIPILIVTAPNTDPALDRKLTPEAQALAGGYANIFVPGGFGALPMSSAEDIFGVEKVERVAGKTGLDTSNEVARTLVDTGRLSVSSVGIANGEKEMKGVDALAAASLCGKNNAPIILVDRQGTASGISDYITDNAHTIESLDIFGGRYVIPDELQTELEEILKR